ncbi:YciI family protein [Phaeospirillum tilakii]|uniref:YciI family protein n=1 Tax=Phaeospirillum tilakii TaxID=741673 RepID=A0ABW5CCT8_9PROT
MLYLIQVTYLRPLAEIDAQLDAHRAFLAEHFAAGRFLLAGPQEPRVGGVILARGESRAEIEAIVHQDPFLLTGVASAQITAFRPNRKAEDIPDGWLD